MKHEISDEDFEKIKQGMKLIVENLDINIFQLNTGLHVINEFFCLVAMQMSEQDQIEILNRMKIRMQELNKQKPPQFFILRLLA